MQRLGHGGPPSAASRIRLAGLLLLAAHLCLVGWLTLRPLAVPWVAPANLHPLATIRTDLSDGPRAALTGIGGDLLLLAPLGVLLPLATGRLHRGLPGTVTRTVFAGAMLSVVLTLAQSGVPGHVADVDAMLLNTTGVALTAGLAFPPLRRRLRHRDGGPGRTVRSGSGRLGTERPGTGRRRHAGAADDRAGSGRTDGAGTAEVRAADGRVAGRRARGARSGSAAPRAAGLRLREGTAQGSTPRTTRVGTAP
ncbi:VanZ family protein [Streptomyces qinglanensis]|uniref:VanZ family protein n=1 Tax=Streptomyces qinglanensis TaxID=943816 RepID=UPI00094566C9|nr:VanZ family protein [Streptomyces qinglanensis]